MSPSVVGVPFTSNDSFIDIGTPVRYLEIVSDILYPIEVHFVCHLVESLFDVPLLEFVPLKKLMGTVLWIRGIGKIIALILGFFDSILCR